MVEGVNEVNDEENIDEEVIKWYPLHEAVLNSDANLVEKIIRKKKHPVD